MLPPTTQRPASQIGHAIPEVPAHRLGQSPELDGLSLLRGPEEDRALAADEVGQEERSCLLDAAPRP